ncbi:hypothetical protein P691DRAFT_655722 [Macrolepiota fuliginosa MF-IS2]|uniref:Uncharacterized protein n=1 Tax=Macrolepiota fuliginosa MF-IS2 TaxID=1400762 RepID=A0A9P5XRR3_9AGAR|nr:hypothetical protein P691DRAFT_655722 [Macrolepiota fuliginosa MF-IS2]
MSLGDLLEDPFGPYPDFQILDPEWPRKGGPKIRPILRAVHMKCGGDYIGLDDTEFLKSPPSTSRIVKQGVQVFGELSIDKLSWLSPAGREWLQCDLRKRDDDLRTAGKPSRLTLEAIYGDGVNSGSKISVWLKFDMNLTAAYMTLNDDPKALVLQAQDRHRSFHIQNLDPKTYELSRNFLERYRLRRLIHELIDGSDTPIQDRNIDWLVNQYLAQVRPMDKYFRIIYRPLDGKGADPKKGDMKLKQPRHLRRIHKAEIRGIFARQAEWILADQITSSSPNAKYLGISQWVQFVKQVKAARQEAWAQGSRWGMPWNEDGSTRSDIGGGIDLTRFGGTREEWDHCLQLALGNPIPWTHRRAIQNNAPKPTSPAVPPTRVAKKVLPPPQVQQQERPNPPHQRVVSVDYLYDDSFSEASTPPATDSESEADLQHDKQLTQMPWYCGLPPALEPTQHVWRCPGCSDYEIDLLQPAEDELEDIPEAHAELLRTKAWAKVTDPDVVAAFGYLVNNHYAGHMKGLGMQLATDNNKVN